MSGDDSSLSLRAPVRETVFRPFPLASPSGVLYIERMFLLRLCINQPIHYLRLYRSLYSNTFSSGRIVSGHFPSGRSRVRVFSYRHTMSGYFPSGHSRVRAFSYGHTMSRHFPSGCSRVTAFSFWTQLCQGKWHPDDTCYSTTVTLAVKARNITANTRVVFANSQQVPGIVTQSSSILYI